MGLSDQHFLDAKKSGLTDALIASMELYSASKEEVVSKVGAKKVDGTSWMGIRYLHTKDFVRYRQFGGDPKFKYLQPYRTTNHLYLPPGITSEHLSDATLPLFITEGEKKAAKLFLEGVTAAGLGGWWAWSKGQKELVDELAGASWTNREVYLVPDSDVWAGTPVNGYQGQSNGPLLQGVYELMAKLRGLDAKVSVLHIRTSGGGAKLGIDDFLITGGRLFDLAKIRHNSPAWSPFKKQAPEQVNKSVVVKYLGRSAAGNSCHIFRPDHWQLLEIMDTSLSQSLSRIAPFDQWADAFPRGTDGVDKDRAASSIIERCNDAGVFDPLTSVRGRGAWLDEGRVVVNLGDKLFVDGEFKSHSEFTSKWFYSKGARIELDAKAKPCDPGDLIELSEAISWDAPGSAILFVGWLVTAIASACLDWRPHLYLTGRSQSGKSYVMDRIVGKLISNYGSRFNLGSTEAGIRAQLQGDALPVLFDEADARENRRAQELLEGVLALARQATSGDGRIVKSDAGQHVRAYYIRSCFALSSIEVALAGAADESRFLRLELKAPNSQENGARAERFMKLDELVSRFDTSSFILRVLEVLPTIVRDQAEYRRETGRAFGNQRLGDCVGTVLCGYGAFVGGEDAEDFVGRMREELGYLADGAAAAAGEDEHDLLSKLLSYRLREAPAEGKSLGDLIDDDRKGSLDSFGERVLNAYAIRVTVVGETEVLALGIGNSNLSGQVFGRRGWASILKRLSPELSAGTAIRYGASGRHRSILINTLHLG